MSASDPHLLRATQLIQLGRYEAAEKELRAALLADPQSARAHSLLANCLLERKAYDEAQREAETAVGGEPDNPFHHYVLSSIWYERRYFDRAAAAVDEAIRLAPYDADYHALRGAIYFQHSQWQEVLREAEIGLQFDAEHTRCNNLRAMALVKLGRRTEAGATIDSVLANDPEDSLSHANKGWTLLEARKPKEALGHFREALRLEPTNEWARLGIIESLKARNPIYAILLRYMLWMAKLSPRARWGVLIGGYFGVNYLSDLGERNPDLSIITTPIVIVYLLFVLLTWLGQPLFNLLLRLHPVGRYALSDEERLEANCIGGVLLTAACLYGLSFLYTLGGVPWFLLEITALWTACLCLPLHLTFVASPGWPRQTLLGVTACLAIITVAWFFLVWSFELQMARSLTTLFKFGMIAVVWGGQAIAGVVPKR